MIQFFQFLCISYTSSSSSQSSFISSLSFLFHLLPLTFFSLSSSSSTSSSFLFLVFLVGGDHTQKCSKLTPGSAFRNHLGNHVGCQGLNPHWMHVRKALYPLYYISSSLLFQCFQYTYIRNSDPLYNNMIPLHNITSWVL